MDFKDAKAVAPPLTPHDIFGYLVPGGTLVMAVYQFEFWAKNLFRGAESAFHSPTYTAITSTAISSTTNPATPATTPGTWASAVVYLLAIAVVAYVAGHLIASISVLFVDRMLVRKGHGYPYRTLLKIPLTEGLKADVSSPFYKGLFLWVNVYLIVRYCTIFSESSSTQTLATFLGYFLTFAIVAKMFISPLTLRFFPELTKGFWKAFAVPYDLAGNFVARFSKTRTPFSDKFISLYSKSFEEAFGITPQSAETGNFWLTSLLIRDRAPALEITLARWHYLYSFSRNLATAFYLAFLYCLISLFIQRDRLAELTDYNQGALFALPLALFGASIVLLGRYYYLYVSKHTKLLIRTFVYLTRSRKFSEQPPQAQPPLAALPTLDD